jgi:hypothetical protein
VLVDFQLFCQNALQLLGRVVLYKGGARAAAFDLQAMASVLSFGVLVCGSDEGDDQVLEGGKKLVRLLVFGDRCIFCSSWFL